MKSFAKLLNQSVLKLKRRKLFISLILVFSMKEITLAQSQFKQNSHFINPNPFSLKGQIKFSPNYLNVFPLRLAPNQYFSNWSLFCEAEYRFEKNTGLPLRFRLGSLDYVNGLEGKGKK